MASSTVWYLEAGCSRPQDRLPYLPLPPLDMTSQVRRLLRKEGAVKDSAFLGVRLADGLKLDTSSLGLRTKVSYGDKDSIMIYTGLDDISRAKAIAGKVIQEVRMDGELSCQPNLAVAVAKLQVGKDLPKNFAKALSVMKLYSILCKSTAARYLECS